MLRHLIRLNIRILRRSITTNSDVELENKKPVNFIVVEDESKCKKDDEPVCVACQVRNFK